jgi:hypothetical protein
MSLLASHIHSYRPLDVTMFTDTSGSWGCGGTDVSTGSCAWEDSRQEVNIATKQWQNSQIRQHGSSGDSEVKNQSG